MLLRHMDTPPPDINLRALVVSIFHFPRGRVMKGDLPCSGPVSMQTLPGDFFVISLDIVTEKASAGFITVHIWLLSVTESLELPPQNGAVVMSGIQKFDLREWLVPPILVPLFLGLIVAGSVVVRW